MNKQLAAGLFGGLLVATVALSIVALTSERLENVQPAFLGSGTAPEIAITPLDPQPIDIVVEALDVSLDHSYSGQISLEGTPVIPKATYICETDSIGHESNAIYPKYVLNCYLKD